MNQILSSFDLLVSTALMPHPGALRSRETAWKASQTADRVRIELSSLSKLANSIPLFLG